MKYCLKCGAKTNGDAMFCPVCEAEMNAKTHEDTNTTGFKEDDDQYNFNDRVKPVSTSNNNFARYSSIFVVLAVIAFIAYQAGLFDKIGAFLSGASRDVTVSVTNKTSLPSDWKEGRLLDQISIDMSVKNNTNRIIRGIEGKIFIYDMFGKKLMEEQADITGRQIKGGEKINVNLSFDANSLIEKEVKAFESDFEDLKISYNVTKIVYK